MSIIEKLMQYCERRDKVLKITGTAGPDDVYLIRYILARNRFFCIYIHQFLRSDRDDLHDHPWHFATFLVRGAYTERKWNPRTEQVETIRRVAKNNRDHSEAILFLNGEVAGNGETRQNRFVFRKATDQHQVVVDRDLKADQKNEAALTIFFGGPVIREWGFVKEDEMFRVKGKVYQDLPVSQQQYLSERKIRRWIPWRKYLGLPDNTPSR